MDYLPKLQVLEIGCQFFPFHHLTILILIVGEPEIQKLEKSGRKVAEF